jgi:DNA polymerase III delta prime subunit
MGVPKLYYGEDFDSILEKVRNDAKELLGVKNLEILLSHGDYQEALPTSKTYLYSMETIQNIVKESSLPPLNGKIRIIALLSADRMLAVHANALLKTLEDAPENFELFLVTDKYQDLIKTILSRVQKIHVQGICKLFDYSFKIEELINFLKEDKYDSFFKGVEEIDKSITENLEFAEKNLRHFFENFLNIYLKNISIAPQSCSKIGQIYDLIDISLKGYLGNIKIKHILENFFMKIKL